MIGIIFWYWAFTQLNAPPWLWALLVISGCAKMISLGYDLYQKLN